MSKIKISLSLMLLISLKMNASESAWKPATLSETLRLEDKYVEVAADLFKHNNASALIDQHYCEQIVANTQKEYKKKDGKISEITTQGILSAVTTVKRNKKELLNELMDSSKKTTLGKRRLKSLETQFKALRDADELTAEQVTTPVAAYTAHVTLSNLLMHQRRFSSIAQQAAAKAPIFNQKKSTWSLWPFGSK